MKTLALLGALGLGLGGCWGSPDLGRRSSGPPLVFPLDGHVHIQPGHARFLSPTRLAIVTFGSSSCPSVPNRVVVDGRHTISIYLVTGSRIGNALIAHPPPSGACTADWGSTGIAVAVDPTRIDVHRALTIRIAYPGSLGPPTTVIAPPL